MSATELIESPPSEEATRREAPESRRGEPAWEVALLYPRQGSWAESEYLSLDTRRLVEFDNGMIEVLPMTTPLHQAIIRFLLALFDDFVVANAKGRVYSAPMEVRLWEGKYREPDLVYVRPEHLIDLRSPPTGAALALEVVSAGAKDRKRDLIEKVADYARAGILEYWIVDPETQTVKVLVLDNGQYRLHGEFAPGEDATSVLLDGLSVAVDDVFDVDVND